LFLILFCFFIVFFLYIFCVLTFVVFSTDIGLYEDLRSQDVESGVNMERIPAGFLGRTVLGRQEVIVKVEDGSPPSSS